MANVVSIAIETTSRFGGVALGVGDEIRAAVRFDASFRHAAQLIGRLDELLRAGEFSPADVREVYVSIGPGSFTGTRIGVVVARTLAEAHSNVALVAVPTPEAVAEGARSADWRHLAFVLDAREGAVWAARFDRRGDDMAPVGVPPAGVVPPAGLLAAAPRPLLVIGEGAGRYDFSGPGVTVGAEALWYPTPEVVWRLGRMRARGGEFASPAEVLPHYVRRPAAERKADR